MWPSISHDKRVGHVLKVLQKVLRSNPTLRAVTKPKKTAFILPSLASAAAARGGAPKRRKQAPVLQPAASATPCSLQMLGMKPASGGRAAPRSSCRRVSVMAGSVTLVLALEGRVQTMQDLQALVLSTLRSYDPPLVTPAVLAAP